MKLARAPITQPSANTGARFAFLVRRRSGWDTIEIGGPIFLGTVALSLFLILTAVAGTLYNVFRDDALLAMASSERRDLRAYEDRIVELRQRIDRLTTRQIANQDTIEDRVAALVARQAELEARYLLLSDLEQRAAQAGLQPSRAAIPVTATGSVSGAPARAPLEARFPLPAAIGGPAVPPRPVPVDEPASAFAPRAFQPVSPGDATTKPPGFEDMKMRGAIKDVVGQVDRRTRAMELHQISTVRKLAEHAEEADGRARRVIAATGLGLDRFERNPEPRAEAKLKSPDGKPAEPLLLRDVSPPQSGLGGPLLPPTGLESGNAFDIHLVRADRALLRAGNSQAVLNRLPLARPLSTEHDITSGFGTRLDPFTRGLAMHSGIDFRAPTGAAVRATAPGKVIEAGYNGGYGRMVEIDHGNGLSTRYAHLSSIQVGEGDVIRAGQVIGTVGSTGRSTGPHLHYEVRIDDDATDPMRFLRASRLMTASAVE
ncbi:MAG: peptidoglycan DD-metalloendopeptidase family protein [Methylobacterium sp.]|nr:peptidoglycan DD-metalloendopeptidase family protein [Methylobacterium sp.]